jgi:arylsulfatase A-like enzyme
MICRCFGILIALTLPATLAAQTKTPNIVFILADDLGVNDLGCYGRKEHSTPNLDKMAKEGMRFTCAYAAQSVCSPTRAAILTGLSPARLHLTTFLPGRADAPSQMLLHPKINQGLPPGTPTLATHLQKAGYATACIGKWHLSSSPTQFGFDVAYAGKANTEPSDTEGGKGEFDLTTHAESFLEKHQKHPFFLYLCHNNPHIPLAAQSDRTKRFADSYNPLYAAVVNTLDESVGRVLSKLDALGLRANTLVIFTSDNGGLHVLEGGVTPTHNTPFRAGKGFLYEGGFRVPLIVRWPGVVKPGVDESTPVISTDWTPTLLNAATAASPPNMDGINLMPVLAGKATQGNRTLCWHQPHYMNQGSRPSGAIRDSNWKLIEHYENGACELYDLASDVGETNDVSAKHPQRVAELRGKLEKWRRDVKAQTNTPNPAFNATQWKSCYGNTDVSRLPADKLATETTSKLKGWRQAMTNVLKKENLIAGTGCIFLEPKHAILHGEKLRYEPEPHKDTVGYWANMNDWAEWKVKVPIKGTFEVELLQAAGKGSGGAVVEVSIAGQTFTHTVKETGHFQRFIPLTIGTVKLEAGEHTLTIKAKTKPGFGVMDLRRVVVRGLEGK